MKNKTSLLKRMVRIGIFGAIATILYVVPIFKFALPIFPPFLEIHLDEIPSFIVGFAYGPIEACGVILVKTLIKLPFTTSLCVGELADLIYSLFFVLPSVIFYRKFKTKKSILFGMGIGTIFQLTISFFANIFMMFPFYSFVFNIGMDQIFEMCKALNSNVNDVTWSLGFFIILPFNALKDAIVIAATIIIALPLNFIFKKK